MGPTPEARRAQMVDAIARDRPGVDERVLQAMRMVPRHEFVDDVVGAERAHDVHRAIPVPGFDPASLTTSVSAPELVAWMLDELRLEPGTRVLEIGAGRGYNAALLAELGCVVTTVEIDPTLVGPTRERLAGFGYDVEVVLGDGDAGVPERAPFDRIVATVGCNDLSPAWFDQLAPDGFLLAPVRHGRRHPLVRATADRRSTFLGMTGFVGVLGAQEGAAGTGDDLDDRALSTLEATWVPRGTGSGPWVIRRLHHDEVIATRAPGGG
jgi:protein-L-isoaspartate(D-aspartate) O-methyltransferase